MNGQTKPIELSMKRNHTVNKPQRGPHPHENASICRVELTTIFCSGSGLALVTSYSLSKVTREKIESNLKQLSEVRTARYSKPNECHSTCFTRSFTFRWTFLDPKPFNSKNEFYIRVTYRINYKYCGQRLYRFHKLRIRNFLRQCDNGHLCWNVMKTIKKTSYFLPLLPSICCLRSKKFVE